MLRPEGIFVTLADENIDVPPELDVVQEVELELNLLGQRGACTTRACSLLMTLSALLASKGLKSEEVTIVCNPLLRISAEGTLEETRRQAPVSMDVFSGGKRVIRAGGKCPALGRAIRRNLAPPRNT